MSVYNDERYISKSVESILNQTFTDFEFIITDDCSKDGSLKILRSYAAKDSRIILIENKENLKLTKNLNNMLSLAKGDLIARMDSDDISFSDRFEKQVQIFKNNPDIDFVFTGTMLIDEDGNEICKSWRPNNIKTILNMMKYNDLIPHPTIMAKKDFFAKAGNYTEMKGFGQEDKELWEKFIKLEVNFHYLNEILLFYRINSKGISYTKNTFSLSYKYKLISLTIDNHNKLKALRTYTSNLNDFNTKEHIYLIIKLITPIKIRYYKSALMQRFKYI